MASSLTAVDSREKKKEEMVGGGPLGWGALAISAAFVMVWGVAMAAEGMESWKAGPFGHFDGCFEGMARAVSGREAAYRKVFHSYVESVDARRDRKAVVEAFIGMKLAEMCSVDGVAESWDSEFEAPLNERESLRQIEGNGDERKRSGVAPSVSSHLRAKSDTNNNAANDECLALADLYDATGGVSWRNQKGWTDRSAVRTNCCRGGMHGIECSGDATHITRLDLSSNNLRGPIPPSFVALKSLTYM